MLRITCCSDYHGHLPLNLKGGDILIIGGDICVSGNEFVQENWVNFKLTKWCREQAKKYKHIVAVWGNHDYVGEHPYLLNMGDFPKNFHLLNNTTVEVEGLKVWGTPYCLPYGSWPFMLPEEKLKDVFALCPNDADVIISHGPPFMYRDGAARHWKASDDDTKWPDPEHVGSKELTRRIKEINPRLVVCGHIHEAFGAVTMPNGTVVVNASRMTLGYQPNNPPVEVFMSQERCISSMDKNITGEQNEEMQSMQKEKTS